MAAPSGPASAAQPETFGPFTDTYSFPVDCGDFSALVEGTSTFRRAVFFDSSGDVTRWVDVIRAPGDVWTNTTTKRAIVVRGEFQQTYTPDLQTGQITVTVRGFRYLVNQPGSGVTVQEVGRIVYNGLDETAVQSMAGQHDLANPDLVEPTLCGAIR